MEIFEVVVYFILLALLSTSIRVVTTSNVIHAAISLVFTLALTAILFLMLSAEFVALVLILVYIGAVIVLFLFGIMITRAPLGKNAELDNDKNKKLGALISGSIFFLFSYILINGFDGEVVVLSGSSTELLGEILLSRFVFPFELVSFVLLAALIGGITLARKDEALVDKDQI
ncbi:MAG: NADH-quinone oxidoreductase subunit J [Candidatus Actinomarina sp.]|nr:NADH-quinone oxidoreductase subunit J [Candidatus Actinomarina sp.]MDA2946658.1 NADH-quinone oxidoreductase subunit J [Actinomycetota bacterium]MBL6762574.1 NADH-quinone oxidoreductase subunit J [Candidatus Actinomarina sp.]MBL6836002.1 NADH-quinone oxidoreductase subunit J [Candidatus Actinomarina sp.]MDA3008206.1 NADH-quinone oxidoreductase subunit J [Actinomycetota bacterium]